MSENALAIIEKSTALEVYSTTNGLDPLIEKIKADIAAQNFDISTEKGRKDMKSYVRRIASTKIDVDDLGKELTADFRLKIELVNKERGRVWDVLENLQKEVLKPLTDWEEKEKARIQKMESIISILEDYGNPPGGGPSAALRERLQGLEAFIVDDSFGEFQLRANGKKGESVFKLQNAIAEAVKREEQEAELERLRKAEEEQKRAEDLRKQKEREDQIAAEAAERARKAAEEKAEREKKEAAEAAEKKLNEEREAKEKAEREIVEAEERRIKEAKEAAEKLQAAEKKAEEDRIAAAKKAEDEKIAAAKRAEEEKAAAVQKERDEAEALKKKEADELAVREADKAHRAKINNEALQALLKSGITEDFGKAIISSIARGEIPHVKINY